MVFNVCLPPFQTAIHCNKLCADGYDVSNLVSADPAVRRRGFKLEYFVRPPLQVTLTFDFKVELCRVDVELWPWGMDRGQTCRKLEISTCSDSLTSVGCEEVQEKKSCDKSEMKCSPHPQSNGHQWSVQAWDWADGATRGAPSSTCRANRESANSEFKLVGRCELRDETKVCFSHSRFRSRHPFQHQPPPPPASCRHEALWSRGAPSLSAVTQLRVALPFGGAASALGLKALSVWGQPARCCPAEQVEEILKAQEARERQTPRTVSPVCVPKRPHRPPASQSSSVPEEFLDPITQELMVLPMLLPSGVSVDHSTLEEYQKREATWGRPPNDPFTSVPFTASSQPLPNPQLKSRIDHFLLQSGQPGTEGRLGRQTEGKNPQASRLVSSVVDEGDTRTTQTEISAFNCEQARKRHTPEHSRESQLPQGKRPRNDAALEAACSSHEQRLSASLDEALSSALQGRPSFTSNLSLNSHQLSPLRPAAATPSSAKKSCSGCSCVISMYTSASSPIYRLPCGHFLCRSCLQKPTRPLNPDTSPASTHVSCPSCRSNTPRSDITRVHH